MIVEYTTHIQNERLSRKKIKSWEDENSRIKLKTINKLLFVERKLGYFLMIWTFFSSCLYRDMMSSITLLNYCLRYSFLHDNLPSCDIRIPYLLPTINFWWRVGILSSSNANGPPTFNNGPSCMLHYLCRHFVFCGRVEFAHIVGPLYFW